MKYKELIDLGFAHIEDNCPAWLAEYGYEYFRVHYIINKKWYMDWDVQKQTVTLHSVSKDGHTLLESWELPDIDTIKNIIRVFGGNKPSRKEK